MPPPGWNRFHETACNERTQVVKRVRLDCQTATARSNPLVGPRKAHRFLRLHGASEPADGQLAVLSTTIA
jgi:hypothetical protein